jgi:hypothetical protein
MADPVDLETSESERLQRAKEKAEAFFDLFIKHKTCVTEEEIRDYIDPDSIVELMMIAIKRVNVVRAGIAANALHGKEGGSRSKADAVRAAWANGNYSSRDICAEQECGALGMSFSAARKALRKTPEPLHRTG